MDRVDIEVSLQVNSIESVDMIIEKCSKVCNVELDFVEIEKNYLRSSISFNRESLIFNSEFCAKRTNHTRYVPANRLQRSRRSVAAVRVMYRFQQSEIDVQERNVCNLCLAVVPRDIASPSHRHLVMPTLPVENRASELGRTRL